MKRKIRSTKFLFTLLAAFLLLIAHRLPLTAQAMNAAKLKQIDAAVNAAIAAKKLPGAVVIVGHNGKIVYRQAFGNRALVPQTEKMTVDTIFDVASLTKPVATATSIMILLERGQIRLSDTVEKFIPKLAGKDAGKPTIEQLLTHTAGFAPDFDLREKWTGNAGMLQALAKEKLRNPPAAKFVYSDIGFIVLGEIAARVSGEKRINYFVEKEIYSPLQMKDSKFYRLSSSALDIIRLRRTAPTETYQSQEKYLSDKLDEEDKDIFLRQQVHDPTAYRMNGIAGHAGLFSTADDLARYCQMILNGGAFEGKRVLSQSTVALMTKPRVVSETGETRGLGWDMNTAFSTNRGELFPLGSFGHTGFTGTGIWLDPTSNTFVVFLSNRVHPDGKGDVTALRGQIATIAASAVEDLNVTKRRQFEADYQKQVESQIPNFKSQIENQRPKTKDQRPISANVLNGIDVLERDNFKQLENLKIGLVTNQTGRDGNGKSTIDVLAAANNLKLVALFSPEHGIRGAADDKVADSIDEQTKLPVYSLYGETRRPKPEQLQNLDALVYDIQDIGARFYTYPATLANVMEEAARAKKPVFVLDRPNPINGVDVEGAIADVDKISFIAAHAIPVRHGLTIGELAQMINHERKLNCDLHIVKMENWQRAMWFDQTNQMWTNPSPNMRSLTEAALYPGVGLLETTNLSVGRGTDTPFEIVGAPYIDAQKFAENLNNRNVSGVRFVPRRFTPTASTFKNQECAGVNLIIVDRARFNSVRAGLEIAAALREMYPNDWKIDDYQKLLVNAETFAQIKRGDQPAQIEKSWNAQIEAYKKRRAQFLLYK